MNLDVNFKRSNPLRTPESLDATQAELPPLPDRFLNMPWPDMPQKMLVVIDGWSDTPKILVGKWVADALGGLLVNSEKIFRALVSASAKSGIDVDDYLRVTSWCEQAAVDLGFAKDGGRALEANVIVNGSRIAGSDFATIGELVTKRAAYDSFWDKVRQVVRGCDFDDRVVVVGSDTGFEFRTPYKFFLDNTSGNRNPTELAGLAYEWAGRSENYRNPGITFFEHGIGTLIVDANRANAADIVCVVLVESVARACEMGFVGGPRETVLDHAYSVADATRKRMQAALTKSSEWFRQEKRWK